MKPKFDEKDVATLDGFGDFISRRCKMTLTVRQAVELNQLLMRYNAVRKKIFDTVSSYAAEETEASAPKIVPAASPTPPDPKPKAKK